MASKQTFFFYDLETSGTNPKEDRIMQFAGQRTTLDLKPIGEPINLLVKMSDDTLPQPKAIQVTGITPQSTQADGLTEAELCRFLMEEVFVPGTISLGYNTIRFDDEFMRYLFWRNFYDPYVWQWQDGRGRWDMLDVVRMTRALRPDGIKWPVRDDGKITNKLDMLTVANNIEHSNAHDAMADVEATIAIAKLIKNKQPQLFDYLFSIRGKKNVQKRVNLENKQTFVYSSGRYGTEHNFTTIAFPLTAGRNGNVLVYDLRYDLQDISRNNETGVLEGTEGCAPVVTGRSPFLFASVVTDCESLPKSPVSLYPIIKELQYNRCPAVAPVGVLKTEEDWKRIDLDKATIEKNLKTLLAHPEFAEQIRLQHEEQKDWPAPIDAESALYDGFLNDADRIRCNAVRNAGAEQLADFEPDFTDERLPELFLHYKARNFAHSLSEHEVSEWEKYRLTRLGRQSKSYLKTIKKLVDQGELKDSIAEDLILWYQSICPSGYEE